GLTRTSSRQPNVKPFICAQHAPIIGKNKEKHKRVATQPGTAGLAICSPELFLWVRGYGETP
ncbi:hypothetical protein, partial [Prevotella sp.]|uniref:hypothetical protein n=1 Tax=Prevotella sp. TaxID=59823 RepID=UPI0025F86E86